MGIGERLFLNNCAACHGSDGAAARASRTWPTATGWAAGPEYDQAKIIVEGRTGVMPPMGAAVGWAEDVKNVAHYVLSLSGSAHDSVAAQPGQGQVRGLRGLPRRRTARATRPWVRPT
jgi:cytochrome c oxidase cbb3-type subunit III